MKFRNFLANVSVPFGLLQVLSRQAREEQGWYLIKFIGFRPIACLLHSACWHTGEKKSPICFRFSECEVVKVPQEGSVKNKDIMGHPIWASLERKWVL